MIKNNVFLIARLYFLASKWQIKYKAAKNIRISNTKTVILMNNLCPGFSNPLEETKATLFGSYK